MKKFAPAATAVIMAALLTASCMTVAFAATPTDTSITGTTGSVTLYKYDSGKVVRDENGNVITGTGDAALAGEPVEGAGFSFYQILTYDSTNGYQLTDLAKSAITAYNATAAEADKIDLDKVIDSIVVKESATAGDDGYATYGTTTDLEELIAIFQAYINKVGYVPTVSEKTTDSTGMATTGDIDLGVYLVTETTIPTNFIATTNSFLVSVPSWNQEANSGAGKWDYTITAYPKDEPYSGTLDKSIVDEGGDKVDTDSLSIGDTVNFEVTGKVPNYGNSVQNASLKLTQDRTIITQEVYDVLPFVFTDTLSTGLTYNDNLKIVVAGSPDILLTQDTGATLSADGKTVAWTEDSDDDYFVKFDEANNKLTVIVKWDSLDIYQGNTITFTYDAVVDADAVVTDGNENKATIYVANNPSTFDGDYSTIETTGSASATDISTVYTYQLDLTKKFDGQDVPAGVNASDVKFEIYKEVTTGESTTKEVYSFINTGDGQYTLWTGNTYVDGDKTYAVIDVIKADGTKPTELGTDYTDDSK